MEDNDVHCNSCGEKLDGDCHVTRCRHFFCVEHCEQTPGGARTPFLFLLRLYSMCVGVTPCPVCGTELGEKDIIKQDLALFSDGNPNLKVRGHPPSPN